MLTQKNILLGISASIAAYKSAFLVRLLVKQGANVKVVMTPSAKHFITPLTLSALSKNSVLSEFTSGSYGDWNSHIELARWADLILIAPATADLIAKMANGICDNLLLTVYFSAPTIHSQYLLKKKNKNSLSASILSDKKNDDGVPVLVAPAMDTEMYMHPATKLNLQKIQSFGNIIIPSSTGELASGLLGEGRMAEPEMILHFISEYLKKKARQKTRKH